MLNKKLEQIYKSLLKKFIHNSNVKDTYFDFFIFFVFSI
jgi:hypothetical protein